MKKLSDYEEKSLHKLGESIHGGRWSNDGLVQLIELAGAFLNAQSIAEYAKANSMSYNGVKNHRQTFTLFNQKFVIDNQ